MLAPGFSSGNAFCTVSSVPRTLVANTRSKPSGVTDSSRARPSPPPALANTTSRPVPPALTCSNTRQVLRLRHVSADRHDRQPDLASQRLQRLGAPPHGVDPGALRHEPPRSGEPDPGSGARHQSGSALELSHDALQFLIDQFRTSSTLISQKLGTVGPWLGHAPSTRRRSSMPPVTASGKRATREPASRTSSR